MYALSYRVIMDYKAVFNKMSCNPKKINNFYRYKIYVCMYIYSNNITRIIPSLILLF